VTTHGGFADGREARMADGRRLAVNLSGDPLGEPVESRTVANVARDVKAIADEFALNQFAVLGRSGGGPHALACGTLPTSR
jgi:pimeloyl-ACP methyl ester carboxylesterase